MPALTANASNVTVIIPTYNAGVLLREAVQSVLMPWSPPQRPEVLVVDDGSTDQSVAAIADLGCRVIRQRNSGEANARNAGIAAAQTPFITFCDADDLICAEGLVPRLDFLMKHDDMDIVGGFPSALIDIEGRVIGEVFANMCHDTNLPAALSLDFYRRGHFFPVSCSLYLYRRSLFERLGTFSDVAATDCDFHFRVLSEMAIPIIRTPVFARRLHATNTYFRNGNQIANGFREDTLAAITSIFRRYRIPTDKIIPWELDFLNLGSSV